LTEADLREADLRGADLQGANLLGVKLNEFHWDNRIKWSNAIGLHTVTGVPRELEQQLEFAAAVLLSKGADLVIQGEVAEAIAAYTEAQALDPELEISAELWNILGLFGSLQGHAADVIFACEKAIVLEPDDEDYRDSRGLARACNGDIPGAIEDFQAVLNKGGLNARKITQRQGWLAALQKGENPFIPVELQSLLLDQQYPNPPWRWNSN
jgi:tetratricopeptide (TPR) repeat protein